MVSAHVVEAMSDTAVGSRSWWGLGPSGAKRLSAIIATEMMTNILKQASRRRNSICKWRRSFIETTPLTKLNENLPCSGWRIVLGRFGMSI
jgi:hypothetical protein